MKVKVCGLSTVEQVKTCVDLGANYCGFILNYPKSHRFIQLEKAKELVNECNCEKPEGCPKCTFTTSRCQTYNEKLDKAGAKEFFNKLELS